MTLMFDSGVILKGEIRCSSPSGIKGLSLYQIKSAPSQAWTTRGFFFNFFSEKRAFSSLNHQGFFLFSLVKCAFRVGVVKQKNKITILAKRDWKNVTTGHWKLKVKNCKLPWPINPKEWPISPYQITSKSDINATGIKQMIINQRNSIVEKIVYISTLGNV